MIMLQPQQRTKLDPSDDAQFYDIPRFVTHVDQGFIDRLEQLYRDRISHHGRVLDLMSSWVSHFPDDLALDWVEGHGMNAAELARNPRLNHYFVQNLNRDPKLPLEDASFDAVTIAVSVQYLEFPEAVFTEIARVLKPGGVAIVSFSNRMFYQKAIQAWRDGSDATRLHLVQQYFRGVQIQGMPAFGPPEAIAERPQTPPILQLFGLGNADPFFAAIAQRVSTD